MQRSPWSVFRKPWFSHTFSVIRQYQNYRKCMEELRFSKNWSQTSLNSRFSELFLWTRKLLFSKRKYQIYEFTNWISWLWSPIQIFEFPAILPRLPMMQLWAWTPLFPWSFLVAVICRKTSENTGRLFLNSKISTH